METKVPRSIEATLAKLYYDFHDVIKRKNIVYISTGTKLVIAEKLIDTKTNETRNNVIDDRYAIFRADKLYIFAIIDKITLEPAKTCKDNTNHHIESYHYVYNVGEISKCNNYDTNINNLFSDGIRYYKSIEGGFYKDLNKSSLNNIFGLTKSWHANGLPNCFIEYVNGYKNGSYTEWYNNGNVKLICTYINNDIHGTLQRWSEDCKLLDEQYYDSEKPHIMGRIMKLTNQK